MAKAPPKSTEDIRKSIQMARRGETVNTASQLDKIRQNLKVIRSNATPAEMSARLRDMCNENGYDPIFELMSMIKHGVKIIAQNSEGEDLVRYVPLKATEMIAIHKELIKYIYPTLKAVDIQGHIEANVSVTVKSYSSPSSGTPVALAQADITEVGREAIAILETKLKNEVQN